MPGLRLTEPQVERLCSASASMSASALRALVSAGFLTPMADGSYARSDMLSGTLAAAGARRRNEVGSDRAPTECRCDA